MIGQGYSVKRRKINLDVIDQQLERLSVAKRGNEKKLINDLRDEIDKLNKKFVELLRRKSGLLTANEKPSYDDIAKQFSDEIDAFAKELGQLGKKMHNGSMLENSFSHQVKTEIKECGRYLRLLARHKPSFIFSPDMKKMNELCTALGGYGISISQDMQNFTIVEVTTFEKGVISKKIESSLGECAGIQHKWASEIVASGTARYPIAISMDVSCYQEHQSAIKDEHYKLVKSHQLHNTNLELMLSRLEAGVPHLLALKNDEPGVGHAIGLRRHPDFVEILDPNFGYYFFRDTTKAAVWLNAILQKYDALDMPCTKLELCVYSAVASEQIQPSKFPTKREVEKDFAKPYTRDGYQAMVYALQGQFVDLITNAKQEKLARIMIKSFSAFADCVNDAERQELKNLVHSFFAEEEFLDEKIIAAYCGSREKYNNLKQAMLKDGVSGCTNLLVRLDEKKPANLMPQNVIDFNNHVKDVELALRNELYAIGERIHEHGIGNQAANSGVKELELRREILGKKYERVVKLDIVSRLEAEFAHNGKCNLDHAIEEFKEEVGAVLDPNQLQPHLDELKAIEKAKEHLAAFCQKYKDKYSDKNNSWHTEISVETQLKLAHQKIGDDIEADLAQQKINELNSYAKRILAVITNDASQSVRESRYLDLLENPRQYITDQVSKRFDLNMKLHEQYIQSIAAIPLNDCAVKLDELSKQNDIAKSKSFKLIVESLLALHNDIRRAMSQKRSIMVPLSVYEARFKNISDNIDHLIKHGEATLTINDDKPKWVRVSSHADPLETRVIYVDELDESSDAAESKSGDHESDAEDTSSERDNVITINERAPQGGDYMQMLDSSHSIAAMNDDIKTHGQAQKLDHQSLNEDFDEQLDELDSVADSLVLAPAIDALFDFKESLTKKRQEYNSNSAINPSDAARIERDKRKVDLKIAFVQARLIDLQSEEKNNSANRVKLADHINSISNLQSNIDTYVDDQLDQSHASRMLEFGKSQDDMYGIYGRLGEAEVTVRQLGMDHQIVSSNCYQSAIQYITKLQNDVLFDMYGMMHAESSIEAYKLREKRVDADIKRIESYISKQKQETSASKNSESRMDSNSNLKTEPVLVRDNATNELQNNLSSEEQDLQDAFIKELELLRLGIVESHYCTEKQYANYTTEVVQEEELKGRKLRLIKLLENKVRANKSLNLADLIGTFLHGEFTLDDYDIKSSGRIEIIKKVKNSEILFKHRRSSGFLSLFNRAYKTETQKLLERYHALATKYRKSGVGKARNG